MEPHLHQCIITIVLCPNVVEITYVILGCNLRGRDKCRAQSPDRARLGTLSCWIPALLLVIQPLGLFPVLLYLLRIRYLKLWVSKVIDVSLGVRPQISGPVLRIGVSHKASFVLFAIGGYWMGRLLSGNRELQAVAIPTWSDRQHLDHNDTRNEAADVRPERDAPARGSSR